MANFQKAVLYLWDAIRKHNTENVAVILNGKFPADAELNPSGMVGLHFAATLGDVDIMKLLVDAGANVNKKDKYGRTALHFACSNGKDEAITLLLALPGIDVNATSLGHETPLSKALQFGHHNSAALLLECGADPTVSNSLGQDARTLAGLTKNEATMKMVDEYASKFPGALEGEEMKD